jgi:hypothetical protein
MNLRYTKRKSVYIAGTSLFGALVFVLDWTFKLTGLKIPFPFLVSLRFDLLGIPILISFFLFGILSGAATSSIAMLSIAFRNPFSGFMRFLAEFTTILGIYIVFRVKGVTNKRWKFIAIGSGILMRVLIMSVANVLLLPLFLPTQTFDTVIILLPLIGVFNAIQGAISIFGGFLFYEAIALRFQDQ